MSVDKLSPCPFCGSEAGLDSSDGKHCVMCLGADCFCSLGEHQDSYGMPDYAYYTEEQAI